MQSREKLSTIPLTAISSELKALKLQISRRTSDPTATLNAVPFLLHQHAQAIIATNIQNRPEEMKEVGDFCRHFSTLLFRICRARYVEHRGDIDPLNIILNERQNESSGRLSSSSSSSFNHSQQTDAIIEGIMRRTGNCSRSYAHSEVHDHLSGKLDHSSDDVLSSTLGEDAFFDDEASFIDPTSTAVSPPSHDHSDANVSPSGHSDDLQPRKVESSFSAPASTSSSTQLRATDDDKASDRSNDDRFHQSPAMTRFPTRRVIRYNNLANTASGRKISTPSSSSPALISLSGSQSLISEIPIFTVPPPIILSPNICHNVHVLLQQYIQHAHYHAEHVRIEHLASVLRCAVLMRNHFSYAFFNEYDAKAVDETIQTSLTMTIRFIQANKDKTQLVNRGHRKVEVRAISTAALVSAAETLFGKIHENAVFFEKPYHHLFNKNSNLLNDANFKDLKLIDAFLPIKSREQMDEKRRLCGPDGAIILSALREFFVEELDERKKSRKEHGLSSSPPFMGIRKSHVNVQDAACVLAFLSQCGIYDETLIQSSVQLLHQFHKPRELNTSHLSSMIQPLFCLGVLGYRHDPLVCQMIKASIPQFNRPDARALRHTSLALAMLKISPADSGVYPSQVEVWWKRLACKVTGVTHHFHVLVDIGYALKTMGIASAKANFMFSKLVFETDKDKRTNLVETNPKQLKNTSFPQEKRFVGTQKSETHERNSSRFSSFLLSEPLPTLLKAITFLGDTSFFTPSDVHWGRSVRLCVNRISEAAATQAYSPVSSFFFPPKKFGGSEANSVSQNAQMESDDLFSSSSLLSSSDKNETNQPFGAHQKRSHETRSTSDEEINNFFNRNHSDGDDRQPISGGSYDRVLLNCNVVGGLSLDGDEVCSRHVARVGGWLNKSKERKAFGSSNENSGIVHDADDINVTRFFESECKLLATIALRDTLVVHAPYIHRKRLVSRVLSTIDTEKSELPPLQQPDGLSDGEAVSPKSTRKTSKMSHRRSPLFTVPASPVPDHAASTFNVSSEAKSFDDTKNSLCAEKTNSFCTSQPNPIAALDSDVVERAETFDEVMRTDSNLPITEGDDDEEVIEMLLNHNCGLTNDVDTKSPCEGDGEGEYLNRTTPPISDVFEELTPNDGDEIQHQQFTNPHVVSLGCVDPLPQTELDPNAQYLLATQWSVLSREEVIERLTAIDPSKLSREFIFQLFERCADNVDGDLQLQTELNLAMGSLFSGLCHQCSLHVGSGESSNPQREERGEFTASQLAQILSFLDVVGEPALAVKENRSAVAALLSYLTLKVKELTRSQSEDVVNVLETFLPLYGNTTEGKSFDLTENELLKKNGELLEKAIRKRFRNL